MKNVKKIFAIALVTLFGLTNVEATSKWDVQREEFENLTDGIKPDSSKEELKLIYTIPEDFTGEKIYINASKELLNIIEGLYVPGQSSNPFTIEIINNSKFTYNYVNDSFKLNTKNMSVLGNEDDYYSYDINNNENGIYIKDAVGFDGQKIAANWSIRRTQNQAITSLYLNSSNLVYNKKTRKHEYTYNGKVLWSVNKNSMSAWRAEITRALLTDEVLGAELKAQGYENGIDDLAKYYLEFFNNYFTTDAKTLYDLTDDAIYGYMNWNKEYVGGLLNGNFYRNKETNPIVNAFGYDWFYNKGLAIYPVVDTEGNKYDDKNTRDNGFYLGDYMRSGNEVTESVLRNDLGTVASNSTASLTPILMSVDGPYVVNVFQTMAFGFDIKLELQKEKVFGKLIVNYVDEDGNKLTDSITTEEEVDTPYSTIQKEFEGFEFIRVEGETTGKYIDGTIEVTYIYKNAVGDVEEPEIPVEPVEPVEPPHTDATINTSNILMYFEDKRKFIK